jgi:hypothetical protein
MAGLEAIITKKLNERNRSRFRAGLFVLSEIAFGAASAE